MVVRVFLTVKQRKFHVHSVLINFYVYAIHHFIKVVVMVILIIIIIVASVMNTSVKYVIPK